ncbi:hypothetical protein EUGRSUZ_H02834 [Eucalyptus grandis]|uniref:Uncharacterized protein n=2 Tax=Eucalyptus grandis TaxID=71139 RepID=A0ACC3JSK7_EUCGR|nr:hypothetical protein EUGRSUZ_H02834 [Eucalyptus grandis]
MGKPTRLILVSLASLVLFCFVCEAAEPDGFFRKDKVQVNITNNLPGGVSLTIHCRSKDDDLGFQTLAPGVSWSFRFRPNAFVSVTLFYCSFQQRRALEAERCRHFCLWSVQPDGPCLFNTNDGKYDICLGWKPESSRLPLPGSMA